MLYKVTKPLIFAIDPEKAHNSAIKFLKYFPNFFCKNIEYKSLSNKIFDIEFKNPIGMAAGFDKNAEIFHKLFNFGFSFVESGTVTLKPQNGNKKPRIFRLEEDESIINRMGFNNIGIESFLKNFKRNKKEDEIVGINIGKNKDSTDFIRDYCILLEKSYEHASYVTINISSPNTKNLRELQKKDNLNLLLEELNNKKDILSKRYRKSLSILLKISPDLSLEEQKDIAEIINDSKISGLIISNTTIARNNLISKNKYQQGGLSGKKLFLLSNIILSNMYKFTKKNIPIISSGGISSAQDVYTKLTLGASLVQIYSAFIYEGFSLVNKIKTELDEILKEKNIKNISEIIGITKID